MNKKVQNIILLTFLISSLTFTFACTTEKNSTTNEQSKIEKNTKEKSEIKEPITDKDAAPEEKIQTKEELKINDKTDIKKEPQLKEFTRAEVSKMNGKDGEIIYVIVNNIVYDVSHMSEWKNGKHYGHNAGRDFTAEMDRSPHGIKILERAKIVGKLVD